MTSAARYWTSSLALADCDFGLPAALRRCEYVFGEPECSAGIDDTARCRAMQRAGLLNLVEISPTAFSRPRAPGTRSMTPRSARSGFQFSSATPLIICKLIFRARRRHHVGAGYLQGRGLRADGWRAGLIVRFRDMPFIGDGPLCGRSDLKMNFGTVSLVAPQTAPSRVSRHFRTDRCALTIASQSTSSDLAADRCFLASAAIRLASTAKAAPSTNPSAMQRRTTAA